MIFRYLHTCLIIVLALITGCFVPFGAIAQIGSSVKAGNEVIEKQADSTIILKTKDSSNLFILEGNVILQQGRSLFYANKCVRNATNKTFEAWGKVRINDSDTTDIYADHLRYLEDKQIAYFDGNVKLTDGKVVLTTPTMEYNMGTHIANYKNGGKIVNKKTIITSSEAFYYSDIKDAYFKRNVVVNDPAYKIEADSLLYNTDNQIARFIAQTTIKDSANRTIKTKEGFYNLKTGEAEFGQRPFINDNNKSTITANKVSLTEKLAQAEGNAIIVDSTRSTIIIANLVYQDRITEAVLATQKPLLIIKQEGDSIFVTADTLFSAKLSELYKMQEMAEARKKAVEDSIQAAADSALNKKMAGNETKLDEPPVAKLKNVTDKVKEDSKNGFPEIEKMPPGQKPPSDSLLTTKKLDIKPSLDSGIAKTTDQVRAKDTTKEGQVAVINEENAKNISLPDSTQKIKDAVKKPKDSLIAINSEKQPALDTNIVRQTDSLKTAEKQKLSSDSLQQKLTKADNKLPVNDSLGKSKIPSPIKDSANAENNQLNLNKSMAKSDSLKLQSDAAKDSTDRYFEAFHNVRIFSDSLQAVSDSMFYSFRDSVFRLYKEPVVWGKENQITGDTIYLHTENKKPSWFEAINNGFMVSMLQQGVFNQIKSSRMDGRFTNGNLDSVKAKGSAESIYFLQDEDSAYTGINKTSSDIIDIYMKNKEIKKVVFRGQPKGTIYPIKQKRPSEMRLEGFQWLEARRPKTKYELFE
ncbi:MAG TPA: OstA-like protein [Niabella sp.]|nr:OstA-like protein [Niabella sp.]